MKKLSGLKLMSASHHQIKVPMGAITSLFLNFDFDNAFATSVTQSAAVFISNLAYSASPARQPDMSRFNTTIVRISEEESTKVSYQPRCTVEVIHLLSNCETIGCINKALHRSDRVPF